MSSKASSILDKVQKELQRNAVPKALEKLEEGIRKYPEEFELYLSALDVALEAGESIKAQKYFSQAMSRFPSYQERLWTEAVGLISRFNDAILAKAALDFTIKKRDFDSSHGVLGYLTDPSVNTLLKRVQTKKQSLSNAAAGGDMALSSERLMNAFAEALLFIRLKRHSEGAEVLLDILAEKPVEHQKLTTLFYELEKTYPSESVFTYALGRCYLAGEQYEKAISKMMECVQRNRTWVHDAIKRLEEIRGKSHVPSEAYNLSMGSLYIMTGDVHEADERIRIVLAKNHEAAPAVLELLEPELTEIGDNLILDYLYIDAALQADQTKLVLRQLRRIYHVKKHQEDLLEWFKTRQKGILPVELLAYYGEITLERNMYATAVEVLRHVVKQSPREAGAVLDLLSEHTSDPDVKELYDELVAESETESESDGESGFKIEHLGGGTKFSTPRSPEQQRRKEDKKHSSPFRDYSPFANGQSRPGIEMDDEPSTSDEKSENAKTTESDRASYIEREISFDSPTPDTKGESGEETRPRWTKEREREITFDSDEKDNSRSETDIEPKVKAELEKKETSHRKPPISFDSDKTEEPEEKKPTEKPAANFDEQLRLFKNNKLGPDEALVLAERALIADRLDDMKELLTLKPETERQTLKHKVCVADYHMATERPMNALHILEAIQIDELSGEARKDCLIRLAACYQSFSRFEAAQRTYLKLISENPGFDGAEHMAKTNYRKYLQEIADGAMVLEKVTDV